MSKEMPVTNRCNAITQDGGYCMKEPSVDAEGDVINGRCYLHGGHPELGKESVEDAADARAIRTDRSEYYKSLSPDEQIWVDETIQSFVDDAPFNNSALGKMEILRNIVVDLHKIRTANNYIHQEGITETKKEVSEDGEVVETEQENIMNLTISRLEKDTTRRLKELNVLQSPDNDQAEATQSLAEVLSGEE